MKRTTFSSFLFALIAIGFSLSAKAQTQVANSDFEDWLDLGEQSERPENWNNLTNAGGDMAVLTSSIKSTYQSEETRPDSDGNYSVKIVTTEIFGIAANGTMTTGQMQAPSMNAEEGFNQTKPEEEDFRQNFTGTPDSLAVWVKYSITDDSDNARISAILHDDYAYTDPEQTEDDADHVVAKAELNFQTDGEWMRLSIPFDYNAGPAEEPQYILLTFTSSAEPGNGVGDATLYVDDLEMIYNEEEEEENQFYFTGFFTEGASQNIDFTMEEPEENGVGDYSEEHEMIINPDEDNPNDISFTASFSEDAHIKMWVSGIPDVGDLEIVDSEEIVESPFVGTSSLLSALSLAPDMSFDLIIAGSKEDLPTPEMEENTSSEIIKVKITIDRDYLDVDSYAKENFTFYPNPVKNELNLKANNTIEEIAVYNSLEQKIKNLKTNNSSLQISMEDLSAGLYFIKVRIDGKENSFKIIKE